MGLANTFEHFVIDLTDSFNVDKVYLTHLFSSICKMLFFMSLPGNACPSVEFLGKFPFPCLLWKLHRQKDEDVQFSMSSALNLRRSWTTRVIAPVFVAYYKCSMLIYAPLSFILWGRSDGKPSIRFKVCWLRQLC